MKIKSGFVLQKVGGSYLAVAVGERAEEFSGLVRMNETGAFLWKLIADKSLTKEEMLAALLGEYDVSEEIASRDIERFEKQLTEAGLLE